MCKFWIAHRGNMIGPDPLKENHPDYLLKALNSGFDVVTEVWLVEGSFWMLGSNRPQYVVDQAFLLDPRVWCRAMNIEALTGLLELGAHVFSHGSDPVVLTSKGIPWVYPGKPIAKGCVASMPERGGIDNYKESDLYKCIGICTDYVWYYWKRGQELAKIHK